MAIDTIKSTAVLDGAIATADIADDAVTSAKIATNAVIADGIATGAVVADGLGTGAVTTAKIANTVNLGRRNLVINGAMNAAQRGTSVTGVTGTGYYTVDRFSTDLTTLATWSISQSTDAPEGFAYSLLHDCTTADASPAAGDTFRLSYRFEGQDLQHLQKGTSSAKSCILSFWIKSNKTGTGQFNIRDIDNNRGINKTYTIDAADTWEKKTILIEGDTTGTISNDNGSSFWLLWVFNSGTGNSSGTFNSAWHSWDWADINAAGTLDIGASTSDYIKITGVQLEVGDTATPFEHRSYGEELALCQRYFIDPASATSLGTSAATFSSLNTGATVDSTAAMYLLPVVLPVTMRANPTVTLGSGTLGVYTSLNANSNGRRACNISTAQNICPTGFAVKAQDNVDTAHSGIRGWWICDAEL